MTLTTILRPPAVKSQEPARCWSAAFESWHELVSTDAGIQPTLSDHELQDWFDGGRGLTNDRGAATNNGARLLQGVGMMKVRRRHGQNITRAYIARLLKSEGHIYCAYYWGNLGHACVIYGATDDGFLVMDPAPSRGLVVYPQDHFFNRYRVWLGTSQLAHLAQSLDAALSGLHEQANSGPSAADIMSQFY